jgi:hypothetical protein
MKITIARYIILLIVIISFLPEVVMAESNDIDGLELNHGKKWDMDEHTRASFIKMAKLALDNEQISLDKEALKKIGSELRSNIDELIEGCTMTGGAHDQLHTYLTAYIPAVEELAQSGNAEDAKKVWHYLENYDEYFQ